MRQELINGCSVLNTNNNMVGIIAEKNDIIYLKHGEYNAVVSNGDIQGIDIDDNIIGSMGFEYMGSGTYRYIFQDTIIYYREGVVVINDEVLPLYYRQVHKLQVLIYAITGIMLYYNP